MYIYKYYAALTNALFVLISFFAIHPPLPPRPKNHETNFLKILLKNFMPLHFIAILQSATTAYLRLFSHSSFKVGNKNKSNHM